MRLAVMGLLMATPALAQQSADPAFLQRAIGAVQAQRNQCFDGQASAIAELTGAREEVAKLQARLKELQAAAPAPGEDSPRGTPGKD